MPNRIIKETSLNSASLDALSAEAERLFYRLMLKADDYGCFEARPLVVLSNCFPLKVLEITDDQMESWLSELEQQDIIERYEVDGRPYLHFVHWEKHNGRPRAKNPKYPLPQSHDSTCNHMRAEDSTPKHVQEDGPVFVSEFGDVSESECEHVSEAREDAPGAEGEVSVVQGVVSEVERITGKPWVSIGGGELHEACLEVEERHRRTALDTLRAKWPRGKIKEPYGWLAETMRGVKDSVEHQGGPGPPKPGSAGDLSEFVR